MALGVRSQATALPTAVNTLQCLCQSENEFYVVSSLVTVASWLLRPHLRSFLSEPVYLLFLFLERSSPDSQGSLKSLLRDAP